MLIDNLKNQVFLLSNKKTQDSSYENNNLLRLLNEKERKITSLQMENDEL